ncbi:MAG: Phage-related protein [Frankiales bacterium]|nr:Phage-related protein [Frankiales bacterium]
MTAYDAGTAFLTIVPSFRGVQQKIDAEVAKWNASIRQGIADALPAGIREGARAAQGQGDKAGDDFGGAFSRAVRRRLEAGLKALPKVEINADSSDTDLKIAAIRAQLEELRSKRIGIDVDEGQALAEVALMEAQLRQLAAESPNVQVRVDAAAAATELAAVAAEVDRLDGRTAHVKVDVDTSGAGAAVAGGGLLSGLGGLGGGSGLLQAGIAASPLAVPAGAAAIGGLAGIATVAGASAGGLGTLILGLSNVSQAVKDVAAQHLQAGSAASTAAATQIRSALAVAGAERGVVSAQQALANARANAADAAVRAAERVQAALQQEAQAERNVTSAQLAERDALNAVTEARKTAAQQIEDLTNAVADGQLSQRQAELDITRARQNLQQVNSNPLSTNVDRQQARLDYDAAVQRLTDLGVQQQRLTDQQADAVKKGVDGADVVVAAQRNLQQATQAVTDAYTAQAGAEQAVTDARREQAAQARQSAYSIAQADAQVLIAAAALQTAQLSAATASNSGFAQIESRLATLSPAALAFATFVNSILKPAMDGLRSTVQAGLLPGLQEGLASLLPLLPTLGKFLGGLGKTLGDIFTAGAQALSSPFWKRFFDYVSATAGPTLAIFAEVVGNLATGFAGLLMAFKPVSDQIGKGILDLTGKFADWATQLGSNSGFQAFLAYVKREGPAVAHFFGDVLQIAGKLLEGLAPLGAILLDATNSVLDLINSLGPEGLLLAIGAVAAAIAIVGGPVTALVVSITAFAGAIVYAYQHVKPFHDFINDKVMPVLKSLGDYVRDKLIPVLERIWKDVLSGLRGALDTVREAIDRNRPQLSELLNAFKKFGDFIVVHVLPILGPLLKEVIKSIGTQIGLVIDSVGFLVDAFKNVALPGIKLFVKLATATLGTFLDMAASAFGWVPGLGGKLKTAAKQFHDFATDVNNALNGIDGVTVKTTLVHGGTPATRDRNMALGGPVIGPGTGTSDTAGLYALSNGEHVWTAEEVAKLGGHQAMLTLRQHVRGYADGGPVGFDRTSLAAMLPRQASPGVSAADLLSLRSGPAQPLHYEQHLHYPVPDSVGHGEMRAQQLLLHDLSNR